MKVVVDDIGLYLEAGHETPVFREKARPLGWFRNALREFWSDIEALDFTPAFPAFELRRVARGAATLVGGERDWGRWSRAQQAAYSDSLGRLALFAWKQGVEIEVGWLSEPHLGWIDEPGLPDTEGVYRGGRTPLVQKDGAREFVLRNEYLFCREDGRVRSTVVDRGGVRIGSHAGRGYFVLGRSLRVDLDPSADGPVSKVLAEYAGRVERSVPSVAFLRDLAQAPIRRNIPENFEDEFEVGDEQDLQRELGERGISVDKMRRRHRRGYHYVVGKLKQFDASAQRPVKVSLARGDIGSEWQVRREVSLSELIPRQNPPASDCLCHTLKMTEADWRGGTMPLCDICLAKRGVPR